MSVGGDVEADEYVPMIKSKDYQIHINGIEIDG